jgi:antirestriction protein ArdC
MEVENAANADQRVGYPFRPNASRRYSSVVPLLLSRTSQARISYNSIA